MVTEKLFSGDHHNDKDLFIHNTFHGNLACSCQVEEIPDLDMDL